MSNPIVTENLNRGTSAWSFALSSPTAIQAYADQKSLDSGSTITFYASTQTAGTSYSINIYRLGWYQGLGGCLKATITGLTGIAQGYFDGTTLQSCPTAISDSTTHNLEAGWTSVTSWTVPSNACTGVYLAVFTDSSANNWAVSFIVRDTTNRADYLYMYSATTDEAYNPWGGWSLYTNPSVGVKVSVNRPNYNHYGSGNIIYFEMPLIKWLERQGYNIAYCNSFDMHNNVSQLLNYKAILYPGHNEYWTKSMRDGAEAAIAAGVSAGFFGANEAYWQMRFENDNAGNANRTLVCYKVQTANNTLANDPQYGINNTLVTSRWRDPVLNRPENTMIGQMFSSYVNTPLGYAWTTDTLMDTTYTAGTGLVPGQSYGSLLVGYEWNKVQAGGPSNVKTIGTTAVTDFASGADTSNTTFYKAPSGALVISLGSIQWTWALDAYRWTGITSSVVPEMQALMRNFMGALKGPVFSSVQL